MPHSRRILLPVVSIFVICSFLIYFSKNWLGSFHTDWRVLFFANILFLILALLTVAIQTKRNKGGNPHVYVRRVMAGMMMKMFAVVIAMVIYFLLSGEAFSTRAVLGSLIIYLIYLITEVILVTRSIKGGDAHA